MLSRALRAACSPRAAPFIVRLCDAKGPLGMGMGDFPSNVAWAAPLELEGCEAPARDGPTRGGPDGMPHIRTMSTSRAGCSDASLLENRKKL